MLRARARSLANSKLIIDLRHECDYYPMLESELVRHLLPATRDSRENDTRQRLLYLPKAIYVYIRARDYDETFVVILMFMMINGPFFFSLSFARLFITCETIFDCFLRFE